MSLSRVIFYLMAHNADMCRNSPVSLMRTALVFVCISHIIWHNKVWKHRLFRRIKIFIEFLFATY